MSARRICRRRIERGLEQRQRVPLLVRHAPLGLEGHLVELVVKELELLLPQGLHATDRPRVVGVGNVDGVKMHHRLARFVGEVPLAFDDKARDDDRLPLVLRAVGVAQGGRRAARGAHLREGELAHVAHDLGRRLARLAKGEVDPLAAARVAKLGREHGGHAEGGLVVHARGRAGEEDVQVVHGGVVQRRPPQLRRGARGQVGLRRGQHQKVRGGRAEVGVLVGQGEVQLARDVGKAQRRRLGLALA